MTDKPHLRHQLLHDRSRLPDSVRLLAEQQIIAHTLALKHWQHARKIAGYWSVRGEVNTQALMHHVWQSHKQYFLPVIPEHETHLLFAPMTMKSQMHTNRYHIPEPACELTELVSPEDLDVILVPLVGFTAQGGRLGLGKGLYDKTLAPLLKLPRRPYFIGLGFECQKLTHLPLSHWDVLMDAVVTEDSVYSCS
jgi:5-formyltetrahydrofolate cyclo-ligase